MKSSFEIVVTSLVTLSAVAIAGSVVHRTFFEQRGPVTYDMGSPPPVHLGQRWDEIVTTGHRLGPPSAKVTIVEFIDYECPFCAKYVDVIEAIRARHPNDVSLVIQHFPLPMHRFAEVAATVAECSQKSGQFETMQRHLLAKQDSFGLKPWIEFAIEVGIRDTAQFSACVKTRGGADVIAEGKRRGERLGVRGTPTFVINGWHLYHPPSPDELNRIIDAILANENPFPDGLKKG